MRIPYLHIFTEEDRGRMLAQIACVALAIGRDLYSETPPEDGDITALAIGGAEGTVQAVSPRERVAFLTAVWPRMEQALRRIEAAPDTVLRLERRSVRLERARAASPRDLMRALVRGPVNTAAGYAERRVLENVSVPSPDTPANRLVKTMLMILLRDMTAAAELAAVVGAIGVAREVAMLRVRLRHALRRAPWRTLPVAVGTVLPPLPQSVRHSGPYRLLYDTYRRYREGFSFDWENPLFLLPAREMWLLYEYWCLFRVADTLRSMGFRAVAADNFALSRSGLTFSLVRGRASALTFRDPAGQRVTVTYNREFPPYATARRDGWHSRSHAMRPDIVLESDGHLLVLDAKFKTYAETVLTDEEENLPLTADINQCHAYRDGIRHDGAPCVDAAWLLYPGRVRGGNRAVIGYASAETFWSEVGALLLRPQQDSRLPILIQDMLLKGS